ncbi:hypothetical protein H2248_010172 [Termitomyces sp. 'cryptogamus']|nr:hypothetical protein H2248_010172 [Termitomyces sp. 'cryptogamus']
MPSMNANTLPTSPEARIHPLPTALLKLQHYIYQTYLSPSSPYTQSSLFKQYAPLTILLTIFVLPRFIDLSTSTSILPLHILAHLLFGACAGLVALRVLIWVGARMVWAFCEFDLGGAREREKIRGESHRADGEMEMELTQGNLIFGGLFG